MTVTYLQCIILADNLHVNACRTCKQYLLSQQSKILTNDDRVRQTKESKTQKNIDT